MKKIIFITLISIISCMKVAQKTNSLKVTYSHKAVENSFTCDTANVMQSAEQTIVNACDKFIIYIGKQNMVSFLDKSNVYTNLESNGKASFKVIPNIVFKGVLYNVANKNDSIKILSGILKIK